ncbi:hypothetical protein MANES_16G062901v8 [Manihot esculenta]|uniref:Uncharacterized protein n=1 Tax=Manihot esculenta TaxID=3983 RepID=A0ACB7G6R5_MANES|nr:hypothetical protein MANES_16G062901v8 [Manihot esculenta]
MSFFTRRIRYLHLSQTKSLISIIRVFISLQSRSHSHPPQSSVPQPPTGHPSCHPLAKASLFSPSFAASVPQPRPPTHPIASPTATHRPPTLPPTRQSQTCKFQCFTTVSLTG